jgi:hypothetical protein
MATMRSDYPKLWNFSFFLFGVSAGLLAAGVAVRLYL